MRLVTTALALLMALASVPQVAHADPSAADAAVAAGQARAKARDFAGALVHFREADAIAQRPLHACLMGLAYLRQAALGSADLMFRVCRERAPRSAGRRRRGWPRRSGRSRQPWPPRATARSSSASIS